MEINPADNFVENLVRGLEFEVKHPFLLYRNAAQEVIGIWFFNANECEELGNLFSRILDVYPKTSANPKLSPKKSEFVEPKAVSSVAAAGGVREPLSATQSSRHGPEDQSFKDLLNAVINTASTASTVSNPRHSHCQSATLPITSAVASAATTPQILPIQKLGLDTSNSLTSSNHVNRLVKPSSFFTPPSLTRSPSLTMAPFTPVVSSVTPILSPLHPPLIQQHPHSSPLVPPFPPHTPSSSLTPASPPDGFAVNKNKIRDALLMLVQDDQFVEMLYEALRKVHHT